MSIAPSMTSRARLEAVFAGREPDRTPMLGGWIACPEHICALSGATEDEYWADPDGVTIRAYRALGVDGLVDLLKPLKRGDYRFLDIDTYVHARTAQTIEETVAQIDAMPDAGRVVADFDFDSAYADYCRRLVETQARCGDIVWMPARLGGRRLVPVVRALWL